MKKLLVCCLTVTMMFSGLVFPVTAFAEETTDTTATEIVHFDIDFEDYASTDTTFPKDTASADAGAGTWQQITEAGSVKEGVDGKAFYLNAAENSYVEYTPAETVTKGKWLLSADITYDVSGSEAYKTWVLSNATGNPSNYYLIRLENPTGDFGAAIRTTGDSFTGKSVLFKAENNNEVCSLDILMDFDTKTKYYYVDGELKYTHQAEETLTFEIKYLRMYMNNINSIDNLKLVENPQTYSFAETDNTTTKDDYITVKFSDTVNAAASDFVITNKADGTGAATVTEVQKVTGRIYRCKLSQKLAAGEYTVSLTNTGLTSIAGATAKNTTDDFTVLPAYTHFNLDFEDYTTEDTTLPKTTGSADDGAGKWGKQLSSAGAIMNGADGNAYNVAYTDSSYLQYKPTNLIKGGKVLLSLDITYNLNVTTGYKTWGMYYQESGTSYHYILRTESPAGDYGASVSSTSGEAGSFSRKAELFKATSSDEIYTLDILLDFDQLKKYYYVNGVLKYEVDLTLENIAVREFRFYMMNYLNSIDNFKMVENPRPYTFSKKADITTEDEYLTVAFSDTVNATAEDFVITNKTDGTEAATVTEVQRVTGGIYKLKLSQKLAAGEYNIGLTNLYLASVIGTKAANTTAAFKVEKMEFTATGFAFADAEGGASLTANIKNTTAAEKTALLIIAAYDGNEMVDCAVQNILVPAGTAEMEQTLTLTSEKDLSACVVRGYIWNTEDCYPLYEAITK